MHTRNEIEATWDVNEHQGRTYQQVRNSAIGGAIAFIGAGIMLILGILCAIIY